MIINIADRQQIMLRGEKKDCGTKAVELLEIRPKQGLGVNLMPTSKKAKLPKRLPRDVSSALTGSPAWNRQSVEGGPSDALGKKLKELRLDRNMSLADVASETGLSAATLSRIENSKMAPTYVVLLKIIDFFNLDFNDLIPPIASDHSEKFLSTSKDGRDFSVEMKTARRIFPHGQNPLMSFQPLILEISTRRSKDHRLAGHAGVEFCYVLSGKLRFHAQDRNPQTFNEGESVFFDSRIPHAYMSAGKKSVRLLVVSSFRSGLHEAHEQRQVDAL